jgi:3-hydroxyacyl-[acyl-carrier-protein] dehydratase
MNRAPDAIADAVPWHVPFDHPAFAGHFPGLPVLPGVVALSQVLECCVNSLGEAWARDPVQFSMVKFLVPLMPGDRCTIHLAAGADAGRVRAEVRKGEAVAVSASVELLAPATAAV